jgi:uncharacterized protein (TIGR02453 family)
LHKAQGDRAVHHEQSSITEDVPTKTSDGFPGFSEEGLGFLKKLAKNNDREWFQPRKPIFEEQLQKPMAQLMQALERDLQKQMPLKTPSKGGVFRIYRDVRFSADKSPYKTNIGGVLYRDGKKATPGGLYVHIAHDEHFAAAGFWQPERPLLTSWRHKMQDAPEKFLAVIKQLKTLKLSTEHSLQRLPRGFEAVEGTPIAEYFKLQSFIVSKS